MKIVLGSGSVDPHFLADPDPDPKSQNNADPADPDPKHCFLREGHASPLISLGGTLPPP